MSWKKSIENQRRGMARSQIYLDAKAKERDEVEKRKKAVEAKAAAYDRHLHAMRHIGYF